MQPVLQFTDVGVVRGTTRILDGIDWTVRSGERWVVLGPNGAGKSTLLALAATAIHPTSGRVDILGSTLGGVDVFELRPRIGVSSAMLAERVPAGERVRDLVMSAAYAQVGRWDGADGRQAQYAWGDQTRAVDLLVAFGVGAVIDRTFGTLSEGERKRALIARAMMTDPELLLLDEPSAGLDVGGREALVRVLDDLAADPYAPATVLVSHHVEEIPPSFTHALLLRGGRVVARGPVATTVTSPALSETFGTPLRVSRFGGRLVAFSADRLRAPAATG